MRRLNLSSTVASLLSITVLCTIFLVASSNASAKTIYVNPGSGDNNWSKDGAVLFAHSWGAQDHDAKLSTFSGEILSADIPDGNNGILFVRMPSGSTAINWNTKWNQTADLTIPSGKNMYTFTGWGGTDGSWSTYTPSGDNPGPGDNPGTGGEDDPTFTSAVPAQCEDIMLQAFYWNSYPEGDATYGTSAWSVLKNQAGEINGYFDMVWLPPSSKAKDDMGYLPVKYADQNSKMGYEFELQALINAFHAGNTRVIADVVINHAGDKDWVNFEEQDFGEYGLFKPHSKWITSNDEAKDHGYASKLGPHADDGQHNANYAAARDWDHQNDSVQKMCKAYLKYLKNTVGYDGFRFDYAGGFHVTHTRDYLRASAPYFSVMEYWDGNVNNLKSRIDESEHTTLTLDYAAYYTALQQGIAANDYSKCNNAGLRQKGYSKYAVYFVDNHDTFNRNGQDDPVDVGGSKNGSTTINNRALMLQCNAYILAMPGVPCIFYPHWYKYKDAIKAMIIARKSAGIHSESTIQEQVVNGGYKATITGKRGNLILYLGNAANEAAPAGYTQAIKENKVAMYYTGTTYVPTEGTGDTGEGELDGGNPDAYDAIAYKFYAIGWINGADQGEAAYNVYDNNYKFEDGKLTIQCNMGSYIAVKDEQCNYYYAKGTGNATGDKVTLYWANGWSPCQKWALLQGTRYLIIRKAKFKDKIELESVDKATYDAYHVKPNTAQGINNFNVEPKARKIMVDGQLRIIRGDKTFDIIGRPL